MKFVAKAQFFGQGSQREPGLHADLGTGHLDLDIEHELVGRQAGFSLDATQQGAFAGRQ